jgi:hypothetical protein
MESRLILSRQTRKSYDVFADGLEDFLELFDNESDVEHLGYVYFVNEDSVQKLLQDYPQLIQEV